MCFNFVSKSSGNCLVIAAVLCSSKLRSVTNLFIVSLGVADLLVGIAVLPFSATREVFEASHFHALLGLVGHLFLQTCGDILYQYLHYKSTKCVTNSSDQ
ncbi:Octopamine receptor Oamb [Eumeta japonica]|uniref:Octopamine receptor Oamb n=1 Tax=Eumeta variegata TaxID=151549 RepID=A0A4C1ZU03_EUMVA|nr:Octopamine receptor Oamb [Eumeta japonica]